jgi:flagellar secretion chaperone FliS
LTTTAKEGDVDEVRARYLRDRVMTATPAQRVVMLYDRLTLDLTRAADAADGPSAGVHLGHASSIVAELLGSLDLTAGGPADNLAQLYGYMITELTSIRSTDQRGRLAALREMVAGLRDAFAAAAASLASTASTSAAASLAGAGVGAAPYAAAPTAWVS